MVKTCRRLLKRQRRIWWDQARRLSKLRIPWRKLWNSTTQYMCSISREKSVELKTHLAVKQLILHFICLNYRLFRNQFVIESYPRLRTFRTIWLFFLRITLGECFFPHIIYKMIRYLYQLSSSIVRISMIKFLRSVPNIVSSTMQRDTYSQCVDYHSPELGVDLCKRGIRRNPLCKFCQFGCLISMLDLYIGSSAFLCIA